MIERSVTVGELVHFCARTGDIDHRFMPSPTGAEGVEGHQRIYRRRPHSYQPEFPVSGVCESEGVKLTISGRADGFDLAQGRVEEIKTCRVEPGGIPQAITQLHLAQARLYAALICEALALPELEVRLTWLHLDADREYPLTQQYGRAELDAFLQQCVDTYCHWCAWWTGLRREQDQALHDLRFPHDEFRTGQRELSELVYKCVDRAGQLMLEAPTGIGKTAAVIYPALKALATNKHDRVIFSTAKVAGRRVAEQTLETLETQGLVLRRLSLTAKDSICLSPGKACHAQDCPYAVNFFDKLATARKAAVGRGRLNRESLVALAQEFDLCPYYLSLELLPWVDVVIADLHYLYSLTATLASQISGDGLRWTALVDEAHNLPTRARDMFRASLAKSELMAARREPPASVATSLNRVNRVLLQMQKRDWKQPDFHSESEIDDKLLQSLNDFVACVGEQLAEDVTLLQRHRALMDFYFSVLQFLRVAEKWGSEFRFEMYRGKGKQSLTCVLNCLDPARLLAEKHSLLHASISFSATLSPGDWLRAGLGLGDAAVYRQVDSPFAPEQLQVMINTDIDTRFRSRQQSLPQLARRIDAWLDQHQGNCIVYFPSYRYMDDCLQLLQNSARTRWVQTPRVQGTKAQRAKAEGTKTEELPDLLARERNVVAFCILGGALGEGVDLPGKLLTSVVIVGVGLPQFGNDSEQLREHFDRECGRGFEYAYLYPGLQKVNQALGRVVRDATDSGHALLIDSRYASAQYRQLLAPWWQYGFQTGGLSRPAQTAGR